MKIGDTIKCLDHGFVELIDVMGDDKAIVRAARASYAKDLDEHTDVDDEALIRLLLRHRHTSPFEMVEFKFHCAMPIVVARQWIRHRTANVNELSGRYSELPEVFYVPEQDRIRSQSKTNKQGSSEFVLDEAAAFAIGFENEAKESFRLYQGRLAAGMAKELARNNLPLSTYTRWYWKIDLHNLMHFLGLRLDKHAQYEIRVFAEAMASAVRERCPMTWRAFEDFRLNAVTLTRHEFEALQALMSATNFSSSFASLKAAENAAFPTKRERAEWNEKLNRLLDRDQP